MASDSHCPRLLRMMELPMASPYSRDPPPLILKTLDYVADFHALRIVRNATTVSIGEGPSLDDQEVRDLFARRHESCRAHPPYRVTRKTTLLIIVPPLGVVTVTVPVFAPAGTVVRIAELDTTVNCAGVPLKLTAVAPFRFVPKIITAAPTLPEAGCVSTKGARPVETVKTMPSSSGPPKQAVPKKF